MTVRRPSAYPGGGVTPRSQESRFVAVQTHTLVGNAHLYSGEVLTCTQEELRKKFKNGYVNVYASDGCRYSPQGQI